MARTTTKAPAPKNRLKNERAEALARMTKAELVKTVKTLDARVVSLLNQVATLHSAQDKLAGLAAETLPVRRVTAKELRAAAESVGLDMSAVRVPPAKYPWET